MPSNDPALQQRLDELKESFRGQIDERIVAVFEQVEILRGGPEADHEEALAELRHLSHKLAGTASTFGFIAVGDAAAAIETACDDGAGLAEIEPLFETLAAAGVNA